MSKGMNTNQVVGLLLLKETEISNKIHNVAIELLRIGYESERGKDKIPDLICSIQYSLEEIERIVNR